MRECQIQAFNITTTIHWFQKKKGSERRWPNSCWLLPHCLLLHFIDNDISLITQIDFGLKGYMHSSAHCSTVYDSQDMEATQMSINRGMDKDVAHIYNGILLRHLKEWNKAICSNMNDLEIFILSGQRRRNMCNIPYIQNLKRDDTNEFIYKTETDREWTYFCWGR